MDAEIRIIEGKDFLRTTASGQYDWLETRELLQSIAAKNRPPADHDLLIDIRGIVGPRLDYVDVFNIVTMMQGYQASFRNRIAFLVRPDALIDNIKFGELCAKNRGLTVRIFTNFEEAISWLMHF